MNNLYGHSPQFDKTESKLKINGLDGLKQLQSKAKKRSDANMDSFFPDKMSCVSPTDSVVTSPSGQPQLIFKPVKSQTGINITKSYLFQCECLQKFMKLMIVELSHEEAQELSRFKV